VEVKINYFKDSGKFYADHIMKLKSTTMLDVFEHIRGLHTKGRLPGLRKGARFITLVDSTEGYPNLIGLPAEPVMRDIAYSMLREEWVRCDDLKNQPDEKGILYYSWPDASDNGVQVHAYYWQGSTGDLAVLFKGNDRKIVRGFKPQMCF